MPVPDLGLSFVGEDVDVEEDDEEDEEDVVVVVVFDDPNTLFNFPNIDMDCCCWGCFDVSFLSPVTTTCFLYESSIVGSVAVRPGELML